MGVPQLAVILLLARWDRPLSTAAVAFLLLAQWVLMQSLLEKPREKAPWYNATGTSLYVIGMLITAFALRP
jgi:chlorophyll synthase